MPKKFIRNQTGDFLDNAQNKYNAYKISGQPFYYTGAEHTIDTASGPVVDINSNPELTGAIGAILPMQISTIGADGLTITFTLLINPETWNEGKTNSYQNNYTRSGWVPQLWGPNQDTVSSTGKSAAFMTANGLDNYQSEMSFGYLNLLALITAYRTNGYEFEDFTSVDKITRVIKKVHGVQISYDNQILMGHFNNFTLDEDDEHPYIQNYNFEFIVSALSGTETEIRGHYEPLEIFFSDIRTETVRLVGDPQIKSIAAPTIHPRPQEDRTTIKMWAQMTGLQWGEAFNLGYTDGSVQGNLVLRGLLINYVWKADVKKFYDPKTNKYYDPQSKRFV